MDRMIFVCTGNTCRSPMAEALGKELVQAHNLGIEIISRGISVSIAEPVNEAARAALKKKNIHLDHHISRQIQADDFVKDFIILTMTKQHKTYLLRLYPQVKDRVYTFKEFLGDEGDILDPYGKNQEIYDACAQELKELMIKLMEKY